VLSGARKETQTYREIGEGGAVAFEGKKGKVRAPVDLNRKRRKKTFLSRIAFTGRKGRPHLVETMEEAF